MLIKSFSSLIFFRNNSLMVHNYILFISLNQNIFQNISIMRQDILCYLSKNAADNDDDYKNNNNFLLNFFFFSFI